MITKKNVNMKALEAATTNFSIEGNLFLKVAANQLYDDKHPEEVFEDLVNGFVNHLILLNSVKSFTLNKGSYAGYSSMPITAMAFSTLCALAAPIGVVILLKKMRARKWMYHGPHFLSSPSNPLPEHLGKFR